MKKTVSLGTFWAVIALYVMFSSWPLVSSAEGYTIDPDLVCIGCHEARDMANFSHKAHNVEYKIRCLECHDQGGSEPDDSVLPEGCWDCHGGSLYSVSVNPVDPTTGERPIHIWFAELTGGGEVTVTTSGTGPPPPSALRLGTPPTYYEIDTTATFTGPVEVCIDYSGISLNENNAKLYHLPTGQTNWQDITTSIDTTSDMICGEVTSFSPFAIFYPSGGGGSVGGTAHMASKIELLAPWIALITLVLLSTGIAVSQRFRKKSEK